MAVSGLAGIESMLSQMRAVVRTAQSAPGAQAEDFAPRPANFAAVLQQSLQRVSSVQHAASAQQQAFDMGDPNISLSKVMIDSQKATLGFQMTVQVRNKLVAAYKEISSMAM
ncbi:flagellar hook-basal body complex protein FliE [Schauerella aestuarii]|uniref:flagellar hook-basal body complex protein FliE n=1 Tax=Schauerella aestuarii TaxID=2511204 RepID=UPI0013705F5A|nr:flagellar hook-basal body complex protein FliE [Achromobacter aestuarii]MYZ44871.1 flagellar hook-basal body complex protein FliE [Achromobacter aestuarii]